MSVPWRLATCQIVSPALASTSTPSRVKVTVLPEPLVVITSPLAERLAQLLGKIFQHAQQRIGRRLAKPADRGVAHGVREFRQQRRVPRTLCHQTDGLLGSH